MLQFNGQLFSTDSFQMFSDLLQNMLIIYMDE